MRKILVTVAAILLTACGGGTPTSPSDSAPLTARIVTAHFVFPFAGNDHVDADWQEAYHAWAVAQLGVSPPVIDYNKYKSRAHMGALTGHGSSNGYTEPPQTVIHSIWPSDGHEAVHIYTIPWGFPVALFEEGSPSATRRIRPPETSSRNGAAGRSTTSRASSTRAASCSPSPRSPRPQRFAHGAIKSRIRRPGRSSAT